MSTSGGSTPVRTDKHNSYFQAIQVKRSHYVSFTGTAKNSTVLDDTTSLVRVFATQDCWISIISTGGTAAAAPSGEQVPVTSVSFIPGGITEFIGVPVGLTNAVVSVIRDTTSGTLHISEAA